MALVDKILTQRTAYGAFTGKRSLLLATALVYDNEGTPHSEYVFRKWTRTSSRPAQVLTQPQASGAFTGKRYGVTYFFKLSGIAATTKLVLTGTATMTADPTLIATTQLLCTGQARFSLRGTAQNVTPKA